MKRMFTYAAALVMVVLLSNCKKNEELGTDSYPTTTDADISLAASSTANKVTTIAGMVNSPGFVNGTGSVARFNAPAGIQLLKDGSLYVADTYNNAIRKIAPDGTVTTESLKPDPDGFTIIKPMYVGEDDQKSLHVICATDGDAYSHSWIFNSQREVTAESSVPYTVESCLAKDPYQDVFWFSGGYSIAKHVGTSPYDIGTGPSYDESKFFGPFTERGNSLKGLFVGRNKVIYFSNSSTLFKHTPSGVDAKIHTGLALGNITSIVLNSDCQTIYLAASGYIEKIENNKLIKLAGPNTTTPDGRDGVGFKADVNAFSLALGDHENALYFSDTKTHTIRKLMLK